MQSGAQIESMPSCISGADGANGTNGKDGERGPAGKDGVSTYFHRAYATSADGRQGFSTLYGSGKTYLGTYVDSVKADSTDPTKYQWSLIKGADGEDGVPGKNGTDGKTYYLHIAYATSADGKQGFSTTDGSGKKYIGQCVDLAVKDPTDPAKYTWTMFKGADGANGTNGRGIRSSVPEYYLSTSPSSVVGGSWSTSVPAWSKGRYFWQRLHITWDDGSESYTGPAVNSALTYANERASTAIDTVNSLDQRKVFNLLTDNGKVKGIFTQDGQLFFNANYINGGTIDAANVGISNLMKIGTDDNNVSVKSGSIGFTVDGDSSALDISALGYSVGTQTFSNSGASIVTTEESQKTFNVSEPIGHDSKGKTWISVSFTFRIDSGDPKTEVQTVTVDCNDVNGVLSGVLRFFAGNVWGPSLYYNISKSGNDMELSIVFSAGQDQGGNRRVEIFSMTVNYWTNKPGGSIESGNGTVFLTNKNYPAVLNGGNLFSGEISIPFIYGNTMRNYNLYFENGILVSHKMLTPSDPGFK